MTGALIDFGHGFFLDPLDRIGSEAHEGTSLAEAPG